MVARPSTLPESAAAPVPPAARSGHVAEWLVDLDAVLLDLPPARDARPAGAEAADADDACGCSGAVVLP